MLGSKRRKQGKNNFPLLTGKEDTRMATPVLETRTVIGEPSRECSRYPPSLGYDTEFVPNRSGPSLKSVLRSSFVPLLDSVESSGDLIRLHAHASELHYLTFQKQRKTQSKGSSKGSVIPS